MACCPGWSPQKTRRHRSACGHGVPHTHCHRPNLDACLHSLWQLKSGENLLQMATAGLSPAIVSMNGLNDIITVTVGGVCGGERGEGGRMQAKVNETQCQTDCECTALHLHFSLNCTHKGLLRPRVSKLHKFINCCSVFAECKTRLLHNRPRNG